MFISRCRVMLIGVGLLVACSSSPALAQSKDLPAQIGAEAVRKVKNATVYLKVTTDKGQTAEGSGFLAGESGVVITNAHVIGMLSPNSKPPSRVTVTVHSGEANEMSVVGKILGVDRASDLAVLRIEGKLPAPLQFGLKDELFETQKAYIFGFPFGAQLGKNITVSESSISSLRKNASGTLERIQVNGGMHSGNSGGPVVDSRGDVIGVSVAVIRSTQINFAIPAATVQSLLDGRILEVKAGELFRQNDAVSVPLQIPCLDPFQKIRQIRVEVWTGKPMANRPFSTKQALPQNGDGARQSAVLTIQNDVASGDVPLPKVANGEVAWVQPVLTFAKGDPQWGTPHAFDPTQAIERLPSLLSAKMVEQKERNVHLKVSQSIMLTKGKATVSLAQVAELDILESFELDVKGYSVRTGFALPQVFREEAGKKLRALPNVPAGLQQLAPWFVVDDRNKLLSGHALNLNPKLSAELRDQLEEFSMQIRNAYEATHFTLPNRQLQPRETWTVQLPMMVKDGTKTTAVDLLLTCTYEGLRNRGSNPEALVSFAGRVKGRNEFKDNAEGHVSGKLTINVKRGFISSVKSNIATELSSGASDLSVVAALDVDLQRIEGNPGKIELPKRPAPKVKKDDPNDPKKDLFTKPNASKAPTSYMKIESSPDEPLGQGKNVDIPGNALSVNNLLNRHVAVVGNGWIVRLGGPDGEFPKVGEYRNAERRTTAVNNKPPVLEVDGNGRVARGTGGDFVIWELEMKDNKIVKLAVDFVQRLNNKPLTGKIRFNSSFE